MCPCRIDFSRRAWAEIRAMGRSTSISRFGYGVFMRSLRETADNIASIWRIASFASAIEMWGLTSCSLAGSPFVIGRGR